MMLRELKNAKNKARAHHFLADDPTNRDHLRCDQGTIHKYSVDTHSLTRVSSMSMTLSWLAAI